MHVYPNPDSWDEFYPSEIFIGLGDEEGSADTLPVIKKANIGATIVIGEQGVSSFTYKKVGEIEAIADTTVALVLLNVTSKGWADAWMQ